MVDLNAPVETAPAAIPSEIQPSAPVEQQEVQNAEIQPADPVEEVDPFTISLTERFGMSEDQLRSALSERESLSARLNTTPKVSKFALEVEALKDTPDKLKDYIDTITYDPASKPDEEVLAKELSKKYNLTMDKASEVIREKYGDPEDRTTLQTIELKDAADSARANFNSQRSAVLEAAQKDSRDTVPTELVSKVTASVVGEAPKLQYSRGGIEVEVPVNKSALENTVSEFLTMQVSNGNIVPLADGSLAEADLKTLSDFKNRMTFFMSGAELQQKVHDAAVVATEKRLRQEYAGKKPETPSEEKRKDPEKAETPFERAKREQLSGII